MVKKIIKYICHKIYTIGRFEELRINNLENDKYLSENAIIGKNVFISSSSGIMNSQRDKSKIRIGEGSRLFGDLYTFHYGGEIVIGDNCYIGAQTKIWSAKEINIGNRVLIAHNVNILDNISHPVDWKSRHEEHMNFVETGIHEAVDIKTQKVVIEDDVWIGFNTIILKGVRIGRGAIIGAGSVVVKDVEPWTINVGNPLRCVEKIQPDNI
jgi:acetyltransferase-like isoleucine patch superfamily enzyme